MMDGVQCVTAPNCGKSCGLFCGVVGTEGPPTAEYQDVYTGTNRKYTGTSDPRLGPLARSRLTWC
jgi:hypothetical protein